MVEDNSSSPSAAANRERASSAPDVSIAQGAVSSPASVTRFSTAASSASWTGFARTDLLDGPARDGAWSGTAHALVAELGVGAATHSTLQLALGVAALLAGLGVVCMVMGIAFLWHTKKNMVPKTIPDQMVKEHDKEMASA